MRKLEDKLKQHQERVSKLKKDSENHKRDLITDLFKKMKDAKNDCDRFVKKFLDVPVPATINDRFLSQKYPYEDE